jgi:aldehyde:ferredoxin oxidoreductase
MEFLASDQIAIVDLASGEVETEEFSDELCQEKIGGAGVNLALYNQYADEDPIVLGAGLFTGAMVPGSCLGVATGKSPLTGQVAHAPLTQYLGMELKYSGFDYIVIKNAAASPKMLWVHDGILDVEDAAGLWGLDVWAAVDKVRADKGDDLIQVLGAGPAAEKGSDLAGLMINYWPSGDRFGLGKALAAKNLKLVAIRGLGLLEIADDEEFVEQCVALQAAVKGGAWAGQKGLVDLAKAMGQDALAEWLAPLVHRHRANFNTPFAANTFLFLEGDPSELAEPAAEEMGVLLTDLDAAAGFQQMGLSLKDAGEIIKQCAKLGLDPGLAAKVCAASGKNDAAAISGALDGLGGPVEGLSGPFSPWVPQAAMFGLSEPGDAAWWTRRQALAHLFGLDPLFILLAPELSEEKLVELAALGTELEFSQEGLDAVIGEISG